MQPTLDLDRQSRGRACPSLPPTVYYPPTEDASFWVHGPGRLNIVCGWRVNLIRYAPALDMKRSEETLTHQETVAWLVKTIGLSRARVAELVGVSRQTVHRWESGYKIQRPHWSRLASVTDVLRRAHERLTTADRTRKWLDAPGSIAGRTPMDLIVAGDVDGARALAMSAGSSTVVSAPDYLEAFGDVHPTDVREAHSRQFDEFAEDRRLADLGCDGLSCPASEDD